MEAVESSSTTGGDIGIEEDMQHLGTADSNTPDIADSNMATPVDLGDVCDQEHVNSIGHVTAESACLNKGISGLETMVDENDPSDVTERKSSTEPTIVSQLLKTDK